MAWQSVSTSELVVPGVQYRSTYKLNLPFSQTLYDLIVSAVNAAKPVFRAVNGISVTSVGAVFPTDTTSGNRNPEWSVRVYWQKA